MKSIQIRGTEVWYAEAGSGTPLVLVHGFPVDHSMWHGQIDGLAARCRVIAPDLRGFGRTPPDGECVSMEQFADDLAALLDGLHIVEPVVLCGLSMGGYIALQFWRRHRARLAGLVLCDTRAAADAAETAVARRSTADRVVREGPGFLADAMLPRLFSDEVRQGRPQLIDSVRSVIMATSPAGIAAASRGMAERPDMTQSLAQIACPTMVIVGQNDVISPPAEMRGIAEAIPGATLVDISSAGHMSPLENPAEVNAALRAFLAKLAGE